MAEIYIRAVDLTRAYGTRIIIDGLSITVNPRARIGLIGENGVGKSTLLRLLAGVEEADSGTVQRPARTGLLWQEVPFEPTNTVDDLIEHALADVRAIEQQLADAASSLARNHGAASDDTTACEHYSRALAAAEAAQVWSVDARRASVIAGLGLADVEESRRLDGISGGERARVALAGLLLAKPEALVLDEPTNHLDDEAAVFLEQTLRDWSGPVIFASHDRAFLDATATDLVDLDPGRTTLPRRIGVGTGVAGPVYSSYLTEKAAERDRRAEQYETEQQQLRDLRYGVAVTSRRVTNFKPPSDHEKMGYNLKTGRIHKQVSRRVQNTRRRFDELDAIQVRKPRAPLDFGGIPHGFSAADDSGPLVQLSAVTVGDRLAIESLAIRAGQRLLVTGPNGSGKSTLLGALSGRLALDGGVRGTRRGLSIGLLEQDVRFADPRRTGREVYREVLGEERSARTPLACLGLVAPWEIDRPVGLLSVGQQRRLALALIIAKPPHVFLLDEPTNHLSLALAGELEHALGTYPGAVVIASHDRWLRCRWDADELHLVGGRVAQLAG
ncbi:ABC-F family ATP-binding cassette domain-containing protein [Frigoribacterium sp. CG_9.8]|uniref:ABC-F family ATP-binding cassette domain-containing protein n=1 Tax=Frigoribacterium sp. CG_9.8 TaxID=2787733 RepID=UPI0018CBB1AD|nr:ABC-F family ATP-binding cassette domain-containing protein [Frigoribacterium sp. CG_9.8]MBG6107025.1 macrolide transport system ATP-binding/permease protein [Frigoribacterium sp. CG_9.8]